MEFIDYLMTIFDRRPTVPAVILTLGLALTATSIVAYFIFQFMTWLETIWPKIREVPFIFFISAAFMLVGSISFYIEFLVK